MARVPFLAANWKASGNLALVQTCIEGWESALTSHAAGEIEMWLAPPYPLMPAAIHASNQLNISAQTVSERGEGAFTGSVPAGILTDIGAKGVIIGHSERRTLFGETDDVVASQVKVALEQSLHVILCVGEEKSARESGETWNVVEAQLNAVLKKNGAAAFHHITIAYEPVWAIGTGLAATPEMAQDVHASIRQWLKTNTPECADGTRILYGGSVKPENAADLFEMADIDGGLIGGASLQCGPFLDIARALVAAKSPN